MGRDLVPEVDRGRFGKGGLREANDLRAPFLETTLELVEEDVATGLRNVEEADRAPRHRIESGNPLADRETAFVGGIENHDAFAHGFTSSQMI